MGRKGASYNLYQRNGVFYARLRNEEGKFGSGLNTKATNREDALLVVLGWLKDGVPARKPARQTGDEGNVAKLLGMVSELTLTHENALQILEILKKRDLLKDPAKIRELDDREFIPWLESFWDYDKSDYVKEKLLHRQRIGKRHCYDMANRVKTHWKEAFTGRTIDSLTKKDLKTFSLSLAEKDLAYGSINKILKAGTIALSWAKENDLITNAPHEGLMKFSGKKKKRGILEMEEAEKILSMTWTDQRCYLANLLAATTGLRAGEVLALKRESIGSDRLFITQSWSEKDGLKGTKTDEPRQVPILSDVRDMLLDLADTNPHDVNGFLFYSTTLDRPMDGKRFLIALRDMFVTYAAGLDRSLLSEEEKQEKALALWRARNICFHSWRHYYAARMADRIDARKVMLATGHKSQDVFQSYADHASAQDFIDVERVSRKVFSNLVPGTSRTQKASRTKVSTDQKKTKVLKRTGRDFEFAMNFEATTRRGNMKHH